MARLTEEQKAANKAAHKDRNKAYRARCKEREAAEALGRDEIKASGINDRISAAYDRMESILNERDAKARAIDEQIARLVEAKTAMEVEYDRPIDEARAQRDAASKEKLQAERDLERRLDEQFPDLTGYARWSAAQWEGKCRELDAGKATTDGATDDILAGHPEKQ